MSSRSDRQLQGQGPTTSSAISDCTPLISANATTNYTLFYNPCGLVASSWFNDEFTNFQMSATGDPVTWDRSNIAWPSDRAVKFQRIPTADILANPGIIGVPPPNLAQFVDPTSMDVQNRYFDVTNEDFIVWMRVAGLPTFRKLYAKLPNGLPSGDYSMVVNNRYSTARFGGGTKSIVISNASFIGGYNPFLGYAFIAVGSLCLALALAFFLVNLIKPRKLGDPALLSWNKNAQMYATDN